MAEANAGLTPIEVDVIKWENHKQNEKNWRLHVYCGRVSLLSDIYVYALASLPS